MKVQWKLEFPQLLMLAFMAGISAWAWSSAPDRVPIHWNLRGEVDGYGDKAFGLTFTPVTAAGLYLLLLLLPQIDPGRANIENSAKAYGAIRLSVMAFSTALHLVCVRAALGAKVSMSLFMGLSTAILFIVLGNYLGKLRPNWALPADAPWSMKAGSTTSMACEFQQTERAVRMCESIPVSMLVQRILQESDHDARRSNCDTSGRHLLLRLISHRSLATIILSELGVDLTQLAEDLGRGDETYNCDSSLSEILRYANDYARLFSFPVIDTEHLLLGILQVAEPTIVKSLQYCGLEPCILTAQICERIRNIM